jgi:hypothetical protein
MLTLNDIDNNIAAVHSTAKQCRDLIVKAERDIVYLQGQLDLLTNLRKAHTEAAVEVVEAELAKVNESRVEVPEVADDVDSRMAEALNLMHGTAKRKRRKKQ